MIAPLELTPAADYSTGEFYQYAYDPAGNRLSLTTGGGVVNYAYDDANRLTSVNGQAYTWDNNGNLLNDGLRTYTYDHANRLTQVVSGTLTTGFTYNGAGDRVAKTVDGVETRYTLDPAAGLTQVLQETTGGQTTSYLYGHDLLAQYDSGTWAYHVNDGLGSVRQLADSQGQVVQDYSFSPFGVPLGESGGEPYGYTGEQWDANTGLVFLRARYYAPEVGRFTQRDLWEGNPEHPLTLNLYLYALVNPVNISDPSGLQCTDCLKASDWAEFVLYFSYGISLERGPSGFTFAEPEKLLILETVSEYANLLGGSEALRRNLALSAIRMEWTGSAYSRYEPSDKSITLPPNWYVGRITTSPYRSGQFIITLQPCMEEMLDFPEGSLPIGEIQAKFVLGHEMGHAFHTGNQRALRSFKDHVDLPWAFLASFNPNPIIARNAGRKTFDREVFADVLAAFLYSPDLLNQQMLDWVQVEMPGVLR